MRTLFLNPPSFEGFDGGAKLALRKKRKQFVRDNCRLPAPARTSGSQMRQSCR